jgi:hypothetical protein
MRLESHNSGHQNAYLTAPIGEKIWCTLGPEFGGDAGKCAIILRALYGLKSAGASFRDHLAGCMRHLGWGPCKADSDIWIKPEVRQRRRIPLLGLLSPICGQHTYEPPR